MSEDELQELADATQKEMYAEEESKKLKYEIEELRRDKARLDWLETIRQDDRGEWGEDAISIWDLRGGLKQPVREAIDSAMAAKKAEDETPIDEDNKA